MHLLKKAPIVHLKADETPTKVSSKYIEFVNIFLPKLALEFPKHTKINDHAIELVDD